MLVAFDVPTAGTAGKPATKADAGLLDASFEGKGDDVSALCTGDRGGALVSVFAGVVGGLNDPFFKLPTLLSPILLPFSVLPVLCGVIGLAGKPPNLLVRFATRPEKRSFANGSSREPADLSEVKGEEVVFDVDAVSVPTSVPVPVFVGVKLARKLAAALADEAPTLDVGEEDSRPVDRKRSSFLLSKSLIAAGLRLARSSLARSLAASIRASLAFSRSSSTLIDFASGSVRRYGNVGELPSSS